MPARCGQRDVGIAAVAHEAARMLRMDELTAVRVPTIAQESARELMPARATNRGPAQPARARLTCQ
ncbi:hypothetical protein [Luteococcus sediminum]